MGKFVRHIAIGLLFCLLFSYPMGTVLAVDSTSVEGVIITDADNETTLVGRESAVRAGAGIANSRIERTAAPVEISDNRRKIRLVAWGGFSLAQGIIAWQHTEKMWGTPDGKFHFKNDLRGDRMALTDEVSHMFIGYKLAQIMRLGYEWSGLSRGAAARAGAIQAAIYMSFVEFPMDAYNPKQGFGISDLVADMAGVGLAWIRAGQENPRWDIKTSVKSQFFEGDNRLLAHTDKQYDDYIYWLTYRVSENRYNPIVVGIGYSTNHPAGENVEKEVHFRIGASFSEIGRIFGRRTEQLLSPAEFYFLSVGPQVNWK